MSMSAPVKGAWSLCLFVPVKVVWFLCLFVPVKELWSLCLTCAGFGLFQPLRHSAFDIFIRMYFLILGTSSIRTFLTESFETHKNLVLYYWFQTVWPGVLWVPTYHALHFGKTALPADVDEPRCNDDHAHWADDHQHDKQFAVIAACLAGPGVTRTHTGEVLNADLKCDFH